MNNELNFKNEGYNYYYGVQDNADLIKWMHDVDTNINNIVSTLAKNKTNFLTREEYESAVDLVNDNFRTWNQRDKLLTVTYLMSWLALCGVGLLAYFGYTLGEEVDRVDNKVQQQEFMVKYMRRKLESQGYTFEEE